MRMKRQEGVLDVVQFTFDLVPVFGHTDDKTMFLKREGDENLQPKGSEDSTQLQQMLTSCMINRQILCCIAGVLIGIPISIQRKSYKPFAILGVLGSFVDYSIPYTTDCRMIHNAMQLALQQERHREAVSNSADSKASE
ncbi:hypothetical protein PHYBOEH_006016 [Phytophthora boehmeriae]|uniref:Uncharacterized protein n=1 Tax=Phytophthora boehmeriae TaxID=109152 RepID=A0A8T1WN20_9STRA|nr:hypothetical protein PHYBOEH_006016 [Phytophthora boehmeriae]